MYTVTVTLATATLARYARHNWYPSTSYVGFMLPSLRSTT